MSDGRVQAMPGEQEIWLVGERRTTGEQKYYLSNLPADATLKMLAAAIKARWICEQAHQQLKEELGLGSLRRQVMDRVAPTLSDGHDRLRILQSRRLKAAGRKKKSRGATAAADHAGHQTSHSRHLRCDRHPVDALTAINSSPSLHQIICQSSAKSLIRKFVMRSSTLRCGA